MSPTLGIGSVFMLHRVCDDDTGAFCPNQSLAVSSQFLESFVYGMRRRGYQFVGMDDVHRRLLGKVGDHKILALTFDDGYVDNFRTAYPLLKRLDVPFAIYVTTSFPDGDAILWWYALESLVKANFELSLPGGEKIVCGTPDEKQAAFLSLRERFMFASGGDPVRYWRHLFGMSMDVDWPALCRKNALSWGEIISMAHDPLVTIGAHTVSHRVLASLPEDVARDEIAQSRSRLEEKICLPVHHFCYPFGGRAEAATREFEFAAKLGFKTATTTCFGNLYSNNRASLLALPRVYLSRDFSWLRFRLWSVRRFIRERLVSL